TLSYTVTTGEVVPNASYIKLAVYDNAAGNRQFYMDNLTLTELYKVDTSLNNPRLGTVSRAVTAEGGDDARVVATPFDGAVFEGWYEYGDLVSTDRIYRIRKIDDNHKLQAVFSGKAVKPTTVVQGFEDFDCGNVLYEYYEIVDDPANVYEGKKSLHVKDDKIEIEGDFSVFFPLVSSVEDQMKSDAIYDVYVWIKPARKAESKTYFQVVHSDICNSGDLVLTRLGSGIQMNITPSASGALEVDNGWCKYLVGTVTKTVASREGFGIQVCKFHAFRAEGASIDELYIDRVELAERVPDYANLKFSEKLFNEIPNSGFESPITEQNWAPLTSGLSVEKVTDREYDWQGDHLLQFDAAKSNGEEYVKIIPISTKDKIYTFAAWAKLSKGSDIRVGFYRNGQYEPFENVVNGETGTLPLVDDGKWNRVSFTFNSGENENGYLVIKGTKGTLQLDLVELFFGNKGYASDPNGYGASKATLQMVDPLAFPDITRTVTTYLDDGDDYFEEPVIDEPENTDTKKSTNQKTVKKYRVIKRHHSDVPWLWIVIGILILAALVTGFIILFKRRKKKEKEESK
ncbi:MAG: hypothetical protein IJT66_02500, partial [Clostridia bacterium]|nr:hypothetical protein [Clostridia bacterium]